MADALQSPSPPTLSPNSSPGSPQPDSRTGAGSPEPTQEPPRRTHDRSLVAAAWSAALVGAYLLLSKKKQDRKHNNRRSNLTADASAISEPVLAESAGMEDLTSPNASLEGINPAPTSASCPIPPTPPFAERDIQEQPQMADALQSSSLPTPSPDVSPEPPETGPPLGDDSPQLPHVDPRRIWRRHVRNRSFVVAIWSAVLVGSYLLLSYVQPMPTFTRNFIPRVSFRGDQTIMPVPYGVLVAAVGTYRDELTAYLRYDYLKGIQSLAGSNVFLVPHEEAGGPKYTLYAQMPNDLFAAWRTMGDLLIGGYINSYRLESPPYSQTIRWKNETKLFNAAYQQPVRQRLLEMPRGALTSAVASFILFKVRTDRRVRLHLEPAAGKALSANDARNFAADMIDVAGFYKIPLPMLLGIGAMENNYLDIRGDLKHGVWKRHAQRGDIVLRRRHGRVLVSNYSVGPWQITRETLRYAHDLYLRDRKTRDYNELPARLRPSVRLNFNQLSTGVLTTYAGLLLRHLLDFFHGDVQKAEGAYNGGSRDPNAKYSKGVDMVADYARRVIGMAAGRKGNAVSQTPIILAPKKTPAPETLTAPGE